MTKTRKTLALYRPTGVGEMVTILEADALRFPPRLPEQPIFYPVLNRAYAEQIAERWNAPNPGNGYAGFVTEFQVEAEYAARFEPQVVGSAMHRELWVPAEQLDAFNQHLIGPITLVRAYYGAGYVGPALRRGMMPQHLLAREQLPALESIGRYNGVDLMLEIRMQRVAVQLNFAYWVRTDLTVDGFELDEKIATLRRVRDVWNDAYPTSPLLGSDELDALESSPEQPPRVTEEPDGHN
jgi:hypothetical protein